MEWAFIAMILVVIGMFVAALFIRKTGKVTRCGQNTSYHAYF
jgi:hypothetical protein